MLKLKNNCSLESTVGSTRSYMLSNAVLSACNNFREVTVSVDEFLRPSFSSTLQNITSCSMLLIYFVFMESQLLCYWCCCYKLTREASSACCESDVWNESFTFPLLFSSIPIINLMGSKLKKESRINCHNLTPESTVSSPCHRFHLFSLIDEWILHTRLSLMRKESREKGKIWHFFGSLS